MNEKIVVIDFGGQYSQLIARRIRENHVYSIILPHSVSLNEINSQYPSGIILTGGADDVWENDSKKISSEIFNLNIPILGICYGAQLISKMFGGSVVRSKNKEFGQVPITLLNSEIFNNIEKSNICLMSHSNEIETLSSNFKIIASTKNCKIAAFENFDKKIFGLQFHPEVVHTPFGNELIKNFLVVICKCKCEWNTKNFLETCIKNLKEKIGKKKVLCALSGGLDSTVTSIMLQKAIGEQLYCIFIDHGMMRKNEKDYIKKIFKNNFKINLIIKDAEERFLSKLRNVFQAEEKRKKIGEEFIKIFEEEAIKLGEIDFLAQGTIYPDVIESGLGNSSIIKSHHNVGGIPKNIKFKEIIEPLKMLFKDEVRELGNILNIPKELLLRQPFPGPGFAVRSIGEITKEKLNIVKEANKIFEEEIQKCELNIKINQYFAIVLDTKSVGVMGDCRTYEYVVVLRAVKTLDFMTATWVKIPHEILDKISSRITNEVDHVNRVVYDITCKPPATIEWE
ncbi:MAG: glutamine-hydrolyzing GMP synthase [Clostridiales bacterium]|nr:glutamine-hydrolyzing GMP synthase [Clostridiales bacterium]